MEPRFRGIGLGHWTFQELMLEDGKSAHAAFAESEELIRPINRRKREVFDE